LAFSSKGRCPWSCGLKRSHSTQRVSSCWGRSGRPSQIDLPAHWYGLPVSGWIEGGRTSCTDPARSSNTTSVLRGSPWTGQEILCVTRSGGALKRSLPRFSRPMICGAEFISRLKSMPSSSKIILVCSTLSMSMAHVPLAPCKRPTLWVGFCLVIFSAPLLDQTGAFSGCCQPNLVGPFVPAGIVTRYHPSFEQ
jgi:hypothetical protein